MPLILLGVFATVLSYACCVAAGRADDVSEAYWKAEHKQQS